jgi:hypothetical protein
MNARRIPRPAPLSRSLSEGMGTGYIGSQMGSSTSISVSTESGSRERVKRQKGMGLSVFVPRPGGSGWGEELKSPFEHKPSGSGSGVLGDAEKI